jgi:transposase
VRASRVWAAGARVGHMVVESVELDGAGPGAVVVTQVRMKAGQGGRCSRCQRRCPRYEASCRGSLGAASRRS